MVSGYSLVRMGLHNLMSAVLPYICLLACEAWAYLHLIVQSVMQDQIMGHPDAMRLHGVPRSIIEATQFWVIKVRYLQLIATMTKTRLHGLNKASKLYSPWSSGSSFLPNGSHIFASRQDLRFDKSRSEPSCIGDSLLLNDFGTMIFAS